MTQAFSYYEDLSIRENLDFVARIYGVPDRRGAVARSLERLGLQHRSGQLAGELSGGWKQRLALAASLIHRPQPASPRRADGRGRPQGPPGILGRDPPPLGGGDHGPRHDALHGRGGALPPDRLPRLREPAGQGHRGRGHRSRGAHHLGGDRAGPAGAGRALRGRPGVEQVVPFGNTLHVSGRDAAALEAAIAGFRGAGSRMETHPVRPGGRLHRPDGRGEGQLCLRPRPRAASPSPGSGPWCSRSSSRCGGTGSRSR